MSESPVETGTRTTPPSERFGVIIACRRQDGRWLMVRRAKTLARAPGRIGFPGGEIEAGETQQEAAIREAREEVGIDVRPIKCVWEYDWPNSPWYLYAWLCDWVGGEVIANETEIAEVLWMTREEGGGHPDALDTCADLLAALEKHT